MTNGETTDYADTQAGTVAYTPSSARERRGRVRVPGRRESDPGGIREDASVQSEPGALGGAPGRPDSSTGINVKPFYLDQDEIDPQNGQQSLFDFKFSVSYGDPQEVRVLAKKSLGAVTLNYQVNGGAVQTGPTDEWTGGERYGPGHQDYYHVMRGTVTGTAPGDSVKVWFTGGGATSGSFTYHVQSDRSDTDRHVLIIAAEDYTGASQLPPGDTELTYLSWYTDALTANGIGFDVYDVDAQAAWHRTTWAY